MIKISSLQSASWIWDSDPAIDKEHEKYNRAAFERTCDLEHLPIKEGSTPTVFKVKRLGRKAYFHTLGLPVMLSVQEAVAYGLVAVENGGVDEVKRKGGDYGQRLTDETMDRLFEIGPQVLIELGTFIINLSRPDPT